MSPRPSGSWWPGSKPVTPIRSCWSHPLENLHHRQCRSPGSTCPPWCWLPTRPWRPSFTANSRASGKCVESVTMITTSRRPTSRRPTSISKKTPSYQRTHRPHAPFRHPFPRSWRPSRIYGLVSPETYHGMLLYLEEGMAKERKRGDASWWTSSMSATILIFTHVDRVEIFPGLRRRRGGVSLGDTVSPSGDILDPLRGQTLRRLKR